MSLTPEVTAFFLTDRPKRIPGVCIRGGIVSDINRIPMSERDWSLPIRWDRPATLKYEPVSPTTTIPGERVDVVEDFKTLDEMSKEEEKKYGGRTVYDFVTSEYHEDEDGDGVRKGSW